MIQVQALNAEEAKEFTAKWFIYRNRVFFDRSGLLEGLRDSSQ